MTFLPCMPVPKPMVFVASENKLVRLPPGATGMQLAVYHDEMCQSMTSHLSIPDFSGIR